MVLVLHCGTPRHNVCPAWGRHLWSAADRTIPPVPPFPFWKGEEDSGGHPQYPRQSRLVGIWTPDDTRPNVTLISATRR